MLSSHKPSRHSGNISVKDRLGAAPILCAVYLNSPISICSLRLLTLNVFPDEVTRVSPLDRIKSTYPSSP